MHEIKEELSVSKLVCVLCYFAVRMFGVVESVAVSDGCCIRDDHRGTVDAIDCDEIVNNQPMSVKPNGLTDLVIGWCAGIGDWQKIGD